MASNSTPHQRHNEASAPYKQEAVLRKEYVTDERSAHQIADRYNVTASTIYYWLRKYEIRRRNPKRQQRYTVLGPDEQDELRRLYVEERLSAREIAEKYECSMATVYNRMQEFGIKTNPPLPEEKLRQLYCDRGYSMQQVAYELDHSRQKVRKSLLKHEIISPESG